MTVSLPVVILKAGNAVVLDPPIVFEAPVNVTELMGKEPAWLFTQLPPSVKVPEAALNDPPFKVRSPVIVIAQLPSVTVEPLFVKFPEAVTMVEEKAAISINTTDELIKALNHFNQSDHAERAGTIAYQYLVDHM